MTPQRPASRQSIISFAAMVFASFARTSFGAAIVNHSEAPLPASPVLLNGGFELGTGADADSWLETIANPGAGAGTRVIRSNLDPQSDAFHMLLEVDGGAAPGEVFVTSDLFPVTSEEVFENGSGE